MKIKYSIKPLPVFHEGTRVKIIINDNLSKVEIDQEDYSDLRNTFKTYINIHSDQISHGIFDFHDGMKPEEPVLCVACEDEEYSDNKWYIPIENIIRL